MEPVPIQPVPTRTEMQRRFRCLSQLNTVARQIPWGTCKTAPSSQCKLCPVSLTLIGVFIATVLWQHFTKQAQTELAINLTEKMPKSKRSKVWLYFAQKDSNNATCSSWNQTSACKKGSYMVLRTSRFRTHGKGQHIDGTPWKALERPLRRLRGPRRALPCTVEIPVGPSCRAVQRRIPPWL